MDRNYTLCSYPTPPKSYKSVTATAYISYDGSWGNRRSTFIGVTVGQSPILNHTFVVIDGAVNTSHFEAQCRFHGQSENLLLSYIIYDEPDYSP